MACVTCPYLGNYELLWEDSRPPQRICVKLWCCAGPELQVREGPTVVVDEYFNDVSALYARADILRAEHRAERTLKPEA
jgi:hypothetical protein